MDFIVNDLSVEEQYAGLHDFEQAISQIMEIRRVIRRFGFELFCHRNLLQAKVTPSMTIYDVVQRLDMNRRRAIMPWLTNHGPFWDDDQRHGPNEYFECNANIVTETAVAEAAFCCLSKIDRGLASFAPSSWEFSPITVCHALDDQSRRSVDIQNFWTPGNLEHFLEDQPPSISDWEHLENLSRTRFTSLFFSTNAFACLKGTPFSRAAALRFLSLFQTLNQLAQCFDEHGDRTPEGHEIYQNFFTGRGGDGGRGAIFSDSSDQEKNDFKNELTFPHPENSNATLFCPWHGKVQTPQMRVHFSWPVRAGQTLYVVYVGPKITKR